MTKDQSREDGVPRWADVSNRFAPRLRRDYVLKSSHFLCAFSSVQYRQKDRVCYLGSKSRLISHAESVMSSVSPVDRHVHVCAHNLGS
jgi:hypothetical protein